MAPKFEDPEIAAMCERLTTYLERAMFRQTMIVSAMWAGCLLPFWYIVKVL
jgi:hypothetical protein